MRTSYKKNRPFDFKLIDLVEPNAVLYNRNTGLSNYETMKAKNKIWDEIAKQMGRDVQFCLMRWNNLRYQFQKELRRTTELCPKLGIIRGSTWPYLERLQFLDNLPVKKSTKVSKKFEQTDEEDSNNMEWETSSEISECELDVATQKQSQYQVINEQQILNPTEYTIIGEVVEDPTDEIIEEEIVYEEKDLHTDELQLKELPSEVAKLLDTNSSNIQKMDSLFSSLSDNHRSKVERRIFAFLLKCQLRALMNETIDDLNI